MIVRGRPTWKSKVTCNYYHKKGHTKLDCWKLQNRDKDESGSKRKSKSKAAVAAELSDDDCLVAMSLRVLQKQVGFWIPGFHCIFVPTKICSLLLKRSMVDMFSWEMGHHARCVG